MPSAANRLPPAKSASRLRERGDVVLRAGRAEGAGHGDVVQIMARVLGERADLAIAGERAVDEARIPAAERLVVDPEPRRHAGAIALEQHVGTFRQAVKGIAALRRLQVQVDEALAAREARDRQAARASAHDDDLGAHVREQHRAVRPGCQPGEVEDPHAFKDLARAPPGRPFGRRRCAGRFCRSLSHIHRPLFAVPNIRLNATARPRHTHLWR